ncbi:MAG: sugar phosphate isomerase/epimerase family protein [Pirellulales bacterium]|nr:sugar phosphate isomerase/epimerase family protein [Pirellulales bacterium]
MLPTLSQVCSLPAPFDQQLEDYAAGQCHSVELWLGKVEGYLAQHSLDDLLKLLQRLEIQTPVASFQGGLLLSQGDARREHWALFERRLNYCQTLGVQTMVIAGDLVGPLTQTDLDRVRVSLVQAADLAARHELRLALEFQREAVLANNLQTAASLVADINHPQLGICLDLFHYYCGPSKSEDLGYLTPHNLFHVQLCDLVGTPREMASDADRILPGDGEIPLQPLIAHLQSQGYVGPVSIELMNHQMWQVPARSFGEIAMTALRKLLGQAAME